MKLQFQNLPRHLLKILKIPPTFISLEMFHKNQYMETDGYGDIIQEDARKIFSTNHKAIDAEPNEVFETEEINKPEPFAWQHGSFWLLEDGTRLELASEYPFYFENTPDNKHDCILTTKKYL